MKKPTQLLFFVFFCFSIHSFGQTDVNKDVDVSKVYEQVVKEGYGTPLVYKKLANEYYFKNDYENAKKWYETLFEIEKPTDDVLKFRYTRILKALNLDVETNQYLSVSSAN